MYSKLSPTDFNGVFSSTTLGELEILKLIGSVNLIRLTAKWESVAFFDRPSFLFQRSEYTLVFRSKPRKIFLSKLQSCLIKIITWEGFEEKIWSLFSTKKAIYLD